MVVAVVLVVVVTVATVVEVSGGEKRRRMTHEGIGVKRKLTSPSRFLYMLLNPLCGVGDGGGWR
jgi:hypothetical protein